MTATTDAQHPGFLAQRFKYADRGTTARTEVLGGAAAVGGAMGVSSVTTYVESGAGVAEGARTGLASVITAGLFALAIFFVPIIALVGQGVPVGENTVIHPAVAPALIMVGIPLTFSIAAGIGLGVIGYALVMAATGKARQVHPLMWAIVPFFVAFYAADWLEANVF